MIKESTLDFLKKLSANNNKEWFHSHQKEYKEAKSNFKNFIDILAAKISEFDKNIDPETDKYIFRINRDLRFTKDKRPYKRNFGGMISPGGRKGNLASYYLHLEPGNESFIAGGKYDISSKQLNSIRKLISNKYDEFLDVIGDKTFQEEFGDLDDGKKLKRTPRGFDKVDPANEYLKLKHFIVKRNLNDKEVLKDNLFEKLGEKYKLIYSLNQFLNKVL